MFLNGKDGKARTLVIKSRNCYICCSESMHYAYIHYRIHGDIYGCAYVSHYSIRLFAIRFVTLTM